jgi:hypothetical protein
MDTKIIDVFLFCNELDMLELRLMEHEEVDIFVIVESRKTFTNLDKDLNYEQNKDRYKKWHDKIIYLIIDSYDDSLKTAWDREHYTRNYGLDKIKNDLIDKKIITDDTLILSSDLDEIVNNNILKTCKTLKFDNGKILLMDFYYYNCNWKIQSNWALAKIINYKSLDKIYQGKLQNLRDNKGLPIIYKAGWHLSYFLTVEQISYKLKSFSHTEFSGYQYTNYNNIEDAIRSGRDLFSRSCNILARTSDFDTLPKHISILPEIFHRTSIESKYSDGDCQILYGSKKLYKDVTIFFKENCKISKYPCLHFGDHLVGIDKKIKITDKYGFELLISNKGKLKIKKMVNIKYLDERPLKVLYGAANYYRDVTDFLFVGDSYKSFNEIFGDHLPDNYKTLRIYISDIIIEINEKGEINNATERLNRFLPNNEKKAIIFHQEHLSERGTSIALYDYADYNEKLLNNISIILYKKNHRLTHPKMTQHFQSRFKCIEYENIEEIKNIVNNQGIYAFYNIVGENVKLPLYDCRNLTHSVFSGVMLHGDVHCAISEVVSSFMKVVPHMISLSIEKHNPYRDNMRYELGIPDDAIVIGRHGGKNSFDINYVKEAVIQLVNENENIWFIFLNTQCFIKHDRVIHLDTTIEEYLKCKFILTCDAMLHASILGETFGLAVGEFSVCNKPIITTDTGKLKHLQILGDKAIIYKDIDSLKQLIINIKPILYERDDWNAYNEYSPEKVMKIFNDVFLS